MRTFVASVTVLTANARHVIGQADDVEALLRLHHKQRVAHVLGEADLLVASLHSGFTEVSGGSVDRPSRASLRGRFADYFGSVRFLEWEDVHPPLVRLASPGGAWAEVIVQKRVRAVPADTTRSKREISAVFAWAERWTRSDSAWRLATLVSTDRRDDDASPATLADRVKAYEILRRARIALGGEGAVARIGTLRYLATCEGPRGSFETEVTSARDGRVAFLQRFSTRPRFGAGASLGGAWVLTGDEVVAHDSLDQVLETVVGAHEFHLLAIAPEARYVEPAVGERRAFDGAEVDVVRFADRLGARVEFYYDARTGIPRGFRPVDHTGRGAAEILTVLEDWRRVGEILLPFRITITQGEDAYRYQVTEASVDWIANDSFEAEGYR